MKSMNVLFSMCIVLVLSACGSGGGGGGSSGLPSDGGGNCGGSCGGSGGGGTGGSNNGNAAYYSLETYPLNAPNEDQATAPAGASLIANEFYFKVLDAAQAQFDVGVYQPTCLISGGADFKDYAVVLLHGTLGKNSLSVRVQGNGITVEEIAFDSNIPDKKRIGSATTINGTCTNGKMTLVGGGIIFSNGKAIVYRDANGELYAGFSSDVVLKTGTHSNSDISIDDGAMSATPFDYFERDIVGGFLGSDGISANNMGSTFRVYNGALKMGSNMTTLLVPNGVVSVSGAHHFLIYGVGIYYESVIAKINGRTIILASDGSGSCTNAGGNYSSCNGISRIWTAVEQ